MLFVGVEVIVSHAAAQEEGVLCDDLGWHQVLVFDSLLEGVGTGGVIPVDVEELISVAVNLRLRGGGQSEDVGVEVVEDALEAVIDRAVCLVDDDEIEVEGAELRGFLAVVVDQAHHRLIRGDVDSADAVGIAEQVHRRRFRIMVDEVVVSLVDECCAVSEEEHVADPVRLSQQL